MQKETLNIFVFDTLNVSDSYIPKQVLYLKTKKDNVFSCVRISNALENLFANINNFSRPPTNKVLNSINEIKSYRFYLYGFIY